MYADFESILKPIHDDKSWLNIHIPSGWCVHSKFAYGEVPDPLMIYRGEDCVETFVKHVVEETKRLYNLFPEKSMEALTRKQWDNFNKAQECHICLKEFDKDGENIKVRDHCHYTGRYRGPAHKNCNLRFKIPTYIPIVFHNLSGYDAHLFIKELAKQYGSSNLKAIAENKEKYISFSLDVKVGEYVDKHGKIKDEKIQLRFIDSFRFMASGLDRLSKNLTDDQCKI